ncbi:MAG TPA: hypothetical protein VN923_17130 [Thermoanaerobaculia bacterium]|nr:hypothetical protein [Thermoanaerobaculia bacterium]
MSRSCLSTVLNALPVVFIFAVTAENSGQPVSPPASEPSPLVAPTTPASDATTRGDAATHATEPTTPVTSKDDAPASTTAQPARRWLHWWRDPADERHAGNGCANGSDGVRCESDAGGATAQPAATPTLPPVVFDPEEADSCPPTRHSTPHLVRRDYSWRWCSPP